MDRRIKHPYQLAVALSLVLLTGLFLGSTSLAKAPEQAGVTSSEAKLLEEIRPVALPAVTQLVDSLSGRLMEAMQAGGPAEAISVCRDEAMVLTEKARAASEVAYLKRVGVRLRNPANAPDPHEREALEVFSANGTAKGQYPMEWAQKVALKDGSQQLRYYRAIPLQPQCVACHGPKDQVPESISKSLETFYPGDAATGFKQGDLRGLIVVGIE